MPLMGQLILNYRRLVIFLILLHKMELINIILLLLLLLRQ